MYDECRTCIVSACCEIKTDIGFCDIRRLERDFETLKNLSDTDLEPIFTKEGGCTILKKNNYDVDEYDQTYKKLLKNINLKAV